MIIKNATMLVGDAFEIENGYLSIKEGKIEEIGSGGCPYKNAIDMKRGIVFPSFTNAHVHLMDSVAKDISAYENIGKRVGRDGIKFQILREKKKEVPLGMRSSLREMKALGTSAFCDFREGGLAGVKIKTNIKDGPAGIVLGRPNGGDISAVLDGCDGIGISSTSDYDKRELEEICAVTRKKEKRLAVHAGEVKDDALEAIKLKPDFLVHLTNAGADNLDRVIKSRIPVVLCPRANAMLGVGIPKIKYLLENTTVALGTDNVMVNSPDMFKEIEFTFKVARALGKDYEFSAKGVLKAATINGREILGLKKNSLEEGNIADFVIIKRKKYLYDPILAIIHRFTAGDIRGIVRGESICIKKF